MFLITAGNTVGHVVDKASDAAGKVVDAAGMLNVINKLSFTNILMIPYDHLKLYIHIDTEITEVNLSASLVYECSRM